jgi:hypothetical protein
LCIITAIGGILSPIVTAPFLMSSQTMEDNMTQLENTTSMQNLLMHGEASATLKQNEIHYEFKTPWINAFSRNHENWYQRIKVPSQ